MICLLRGTPREHVYKVESEGPSGTMVFFKKSMLAATRERKALESNIIVHDSVKGKGAEVTSKRGCLRVRKEAVEEKRKRKNKANHYQSARHTS